MNNIQKAFKTKAKCGLRMAVGGVIAPDLNDRTPNGDLDSLTAQSNMSGAMADLSNTERYQLANPTNAPYKANSMMAGTSADASMLRQRSGILSSLRDRLAERTQPAPSPFRFAGGGIIETIRNRNAAMEAATNVGASPAAPAPAAPAPAALPSQASDYAAQAAALEAEQLAAARAATAPKPKQGLMSRLGFARGGIAMVSGPGTGTSDDIPLNLQADGKKLDVKVSDGEALAILPAKTAQNPQAIDAVNQIIYQTNGQPPRGLRSGASYAAGAIPFEDEVRARAAANRAAIPTAPAAPAPAPAAAPTAAPASMAPPLEIPAAEQPGAIRQGINRLAAKVGFQPTAGAAPAAPAAPSAPLSAARQLESAANSAVDLSKVAEPVVNAAKTAAGLPAQVVNGIRNVAGKVGPILAPVAAIADVAGDPTGTGIAQGAYDLASGLGAKAGGWMTAPADIATRVTNNGRGLIQTLGDRFSGKYVPETAAAGTDQLLRLVGIDGPDTLAVKDGQPVKRGIGAAPKPTNAPAPVAVSGDAPLGNTPREVAAPAAPAPAPAALPPDQELQARGGGVQRLVDGAQRDAGISGTDAMANAKRGLRAIAGNDEVRANLNDAHAIQGDGISYSTRNGRTEISGVAPTKNQYVGADGKATNNWYETQDYKDSQVRAAKDKQLLDTYEKNDIAGDLKSNQPFYQARGLRRQEAYNQNAETALKKQVAESDRAYKEGSLDVQREGNELQKRHYGIQEQQMDAARRAAQFGREKDMIEMQRAEREAMDRDEDQMRKTFAGHFLMDSEKGPVEDKAALDDFIRRANQSILDEGQRTKNPALWNATAGRPKSFANVDKATQEQLLNRYNAYRRFKEAQGWLPGYADKADTLNLYDLDAQEDGEHITFPRLTAKLGKPVRAQKKDFMYSKPIGALDLQAVQTPDDTLLRNLLGK